MPMVCYYLEVITLLFFVYVDRVEEGGREGWGNICLEAFILSACISKAISGLSTTLMRVFFFLRRSLGVTSLLSIGLVGKSCNFLN